MSNFEQKLNQNEETKGGCISETINYHIAIRYTDSKYSAYDKDLSNGVTSAEVIKTLT